MLQVLPFSAPTQWPRMHHIIVHLSYGKPPEPHPQHQSFSNVSKLDPLFAGTEYVGAALGCNNRIKEVIAECERMFEENAQIACIVSIETGQTASTEFS